MAPKPDGAPPIDPEKLLDSERGFVDKAMGGEFADMGAAEVTDVMQGLSVAMPGGIGHVVNGAAGYFGDQVRNANTLAAYQAAGIDINKSRTSKAAKYEAEKRAWRPASNLAKLGAQIGGMMVGAAAGTLLIPIPFVGTLVGGGLGGWGGGSAFGYFFERQEQEAVKVAAMATFKYDKGVATTDPETFALLVATHYADKDKDPVNDKLEDLLEAKTGTRNFDVALKMPGGIEAIEHIMETPTGQKAEELAGRALGLVSNDPMERSSSILKRLINTKGLNPNVIVNNPVEVSSAATDLMMEEMNAPPAQAQPANMRALASNALPRGASGMGITPGGAEDINLPPPPAGNASRFVS